MFLQKKVEKRKKEEERWKSTEEVFLHVILIERNVVSKTITSRFQYNISVVLIVSIFMS